MAGHIHQMDSTLTYIFKNVSDQPEYHWAIFPHTCSVTIWTCMHPGTLSVETLWHRSYYPQPRLETCHRLDTRTSMAKRRNIRHLIVHLFMHQEALNKFLVQEVWHKVLDVLHICKTKHCGALLCYVNWYSAFMGVPLYIVTLSYLGRTQMVVFSSIKIGPFSSI